MSKTSFKLATLTIVVVGVSPQDRHRRRVRPTEPSNSTNAKT